MPQKKTAALIARLDAENPTYRDAAFAAHGGVAARDELRVYVEAALRK